jgi:hypothetical protein
MNCCDYNCNQGRDCPARMASVPTTRRYPRTMRQAFGPDTDNRLEPMPEPSSSWGGLAFALFCLCFAVLFIEVVNK